MDLEALLQNMTNMRDLHLALVNISSSVPQSLANFSSLTSLSLSFCNLNGEFPNSIFHLPKIQVIDLSGNKFLTRFLTEFPYGSPLKQLQLSRTRFSGKLPSSIGNLKALNVLNLYLDQNQLNGPLDFQNVSSNLKSPELGGNKLIELFPRPIANLSELYGLV
ncbi:receptor-like protein 7 [Quercus suber]|uniref:Receptor-like protein 7 n=1 Tax=Quercus suber TaxID=58331 RepID=A0AAW0K519_QUESU